MIETDRLHLRRWIESDLDPFHKLNSDPKVIEFLPNALTKEESDSFVENIEAGFEKYGFGWWAVELKDTKKFIGFTGLSAPTFEAEFTPCVEIAWRLSSGHWGKGYATEAAKKALDIGFNQFDLPEILSFTVPDNIRSRRVMEKLGMTYSPDDDFEHPRLPVGDRLSRHVLYRIQNKQKNKG